MTVHLGLDVGSTTVKLVALDEDFNVLYQTYRRHMSDVKKPSGMLLEIAMSSLAIVL